MICKRKSKVILFVWLGVRCSNFVCYQSTTVDMIIASGVVYL